MLHAEREIEWWKPDLARITDNIDAGGAKGWIRLGPANVSTALFSSVWKQYCRVSLPAKAVGHWSLPRTPRTPHKVKTHGRLLVLEALGETLMLVRLLWQWSGRRFSWGGFTLHKVRTRSCDRPDLAQGGCRPPVFGRFSEFESRVYRHAQEQTMHNISTHANKLGT